MTPQAFLSDIIDPTLKWLGIRIMNPSDDRARVMLLAIAGQESTWKWRQQNGGPAHGFWQFELGGGVAEVFDKTPHQLRAVCDALHVPYDANSVYAAMINDDTLACSMARLLLWQDPMSLPAVGDEDTAWDYYYRNWRPGAPSRERWSDVYQQSLQVIRGNTPVA